MFGFSKEDQCSFCGQQLSKKKKKRKKHLDKCNKKEKSQKTKFCEICKFSEKFCHCGAKQKDWKKLDYKTMPYHWDDRNQLFLDYLYLNNLY